MEEANEIPKWEGKATAKLLRPTASEVWPLLEDFCTLHKWLPTIDTCFKVVDEDGLVRHCASEAQWCRERLTGMDPAEMWLSYEVVDSNMGLNNYKSTMKVVPIDGGDGLGCQIEWSFETDPVQGLSCEDLAKYVGIGLQGMALNLERALESAF
ncbi:lachrymatory-factor synthase-like [Salvia hispanica]|uniref:lachrymatory-factor synthase-like n=1 Tax=Salvia hispanica TaxID=49212 RepID=UPI002009C861|nr:lachrymatory-factor synthase-like [Salvia hispanica]